MTDIDHTTVTRHELATCVVEHLKEARVTLMKSGAGFPRDLLDVCQAIVDAGEGVQPEQKLRSNKRKALIHALAVFLTRDVVRKSVALQEGHPDAKDWSTIRNLSSVFGYCTAEDAVKALEQDLA